MVWYICIGLLSGVISGMGIGGGTILIPALSILYDMEQQTAQNINLIYFIPTAIIAIATHVKDGNIEKQGLLKLILFGLIGAVGGSFLAINLDNTILRKLFGGFLLLMGIMEICKKKEKNEQKTAFSK